MGEILKSSDELVKRGIKHRLLLVVSLSAHSTYGQAEDGLMIYQQARERFHAIIKRHTNYEHILCDTQLGVVIDGRDLRRILTISRLHGIKLDYWHKDTIHHMDAEKEKADRARRQADLFHTQEVHPKLASSVPSPNRTRGGKDD